MNRFLLAAIITLIITSSNPVSAENNPCIRISSGSGDNYILDGDIMFRESGGQRIRMFDRVANACADEGVVYYIRSSGDLWFAGFIQGGMSAAEYQLPGRFDKIYKFVCYRKIFYILAEQLADGISDRKPSAVLVRFNPDQSSVNSVEDVSDFHLIQGRAVVINGNIIDYNGTQVPLSINGRLKISAVTDSRIVTVSGADGTEIVDILAAKSIYQYRDNSLPEYPVEYNLAVAFRDNITISPAGNVTNRSIYYVILIDGADENRTSTGAGEAEKLINARLAAGKYHLIKAERWELDPVKGRYIRMNNISQPREIRIYIPENRIIKVNIEFDGSGYIIKQSVVYK